MREHSRPIAGADGFWEPVRSNVVDCFTQFFDYMLPRESLSVVRLVAHFLRERLAWCDAEGNPRAPREILRFEEFSREIALDRKSVRAAVARAVEERYLEIIPSEDPDPVLRLRLDLTQFTLAPELFDGFYPLPTHRIRVPLEFFTTVVPNETLATIKVVACVIRMTLGSIDNIGQSDVTPAISQQQFVRRMNMGRRQAIQGVQSALARNYIRRLEQGSLESGRPSTYGLYWKQVEQALAWPTHAPTVGSPGRPGRASATASRLVKEKGDQAIGGKRDQLTGKKGSGPEEKGIRAEGKGDQDRGKKGSGPDADTDLIKDLDLRSATSSPAPGDSRAESPRLPRPLSPAEAAALEGRIKSRFPLGNPQLIRRHLQERGSLVEEILDALAEVDPAFVKRFTRSADSYWAVFHTCCQQGILPPRRKASTRATTAPLAAVSNGRERDPRDEAEWKARAHREKVDELLEFWSRCHAMYLERRPDPEEMKDIRAALEERMDRFVGKDEAEQWVVEGVIRRRGITLGCES